ncbi:MAG: gas vesicle protein GvpN [Elainellaceae cyanobacterium]
MTTILQARPRQFVNTPSVDRVAKRALQYLQSGYSVHLQGPAGTGKTTLALHLADLLSRPIMLLFGDDEFKTSDLIGNQSGYTRKKVFDNFIHSVVKMEDEVRQNWVDSRLTMACREGFTLVYDEFNRSRPEVNNVLLSALEEKLLVLPPNSSRTEYIRVNPHFRAIFTSNPAEYCGVHATQDALLDRLITINMPEPDELTQQEILVQKTEIDREGAAFVVYLVKAFRLKAVTKDSSGLRACLMIAKVAHQHNIQVDPRDVDFRDLCQDILLARSGKSLNEATQVLWDLLNTLKDQVPILEPQVMEAEPELINAEPELINTESFSEENYNLPGKFERVPSAIQDLHHQDSVPESINELGSEPESQPDENLDEIFGDDQPFTLDEASAIANGGLTSVTFEPGENIPEFDLPNLEFSDELLSSATDLLPDDFSQSHSEEPAGMADGSASESLDVASVDDHAEIDASVTDTPVIDAPVTDTPDTPVTNAPVTDDQPEELESSQTTAPHLHEAEMLQEQLVTPARLNDAAPFEQEVYDHLQQSQNARPSEISEALGISRLETINALRALSIRGLVAPQSPPKNSSSTGSSSNGMMLSTTRLPTHVSAIDLPLQRHTIGGELP